MPGIYLHIPYCKQACHYCDFHFSTVMKTKDDFINALLKEIELQKDYFKPQTLNLKLQTIYFGGGTPSLLSGDEIKKILSKIKSFHTVAADVEFTLEANPDDLSKQKIAELRSAGINRLSIGIQSFADEDLKWMNRAHTSAEAIACVKDAQEAGFDNISVDLIYGTPVLSHRQWEKNLETVSGLDVQHLSCYALTVEPRTALSKFIAGRQVPDVDEHKTSEHFDMLMDWAQANQLEQYEISNFARHQKYSRHNSNYWSGEKYLGLGPSAHSFNGAARQWNVRSNPAYIRAIEEGHVPFEKEELTADQEYNEYVMMGLRTMWGCNIEKMRKQFGEQRTEHFFQNAIAYVDKGLLVMKRQNFVLTREGKFFADRIASDLFIA